VAALALFAPTAHATAPGDNGTVKIHDAETAEELVKNEPHVCTFYLDAFGFDTGQLVDWKIVEMPPTGAKGEVAESSSLGLDLDGRGRTGNLALPDGHYKLVWNFDGENGKAKHKVFWVDCESDSEEPAAEASEEDEATAEDAAKDKAKDETKAAGADEDKSSSEAAAETSDAQTPDDGKSNLAETGSGAPVGIIAGVAAALLAVGGGLVFFLSRRRAGNQG
jgi:LPXTG-motif cell wall-anchored protein